ncbi:MAG: hypothetical protein FWE07_08580 [Turicibacter sp.]|nr:hypothetical protein [Turicibacter sp.]
MMKCKKVVSLVLVITILFSSAPAFAHEHTPEEQAGNEYPLVLVHGLAGWGPDELLGFNYWGGLNSIVNFLNNQGFTTYEAVVGSFSSNRDRAIELYYFLAGGTVDYGAANSERYGLERFGRTFPGILPDWDNEQRIHLIGHSMGGLTSRELANLIAVGCAIEIAFAEEHPEVGISPLLSGQSDRGIHSITTIATPNNGTSFAEEESPFVPFIRLFVTSLAAISNVHPDQILFDFQLDRFGLVRDPEEHFLTYVNRVFSSPIWQSTNLANYSLSVRGIVANAENLQTRPDIYYFSHTGQTTEISPITNRHRNAITTNPLFILPSHFMINFRNTASYPVIDEAWAANDGLVNTISSFYPFGHPAQPYDGNPVIGTWNYHPVMYRWDHMALSGLGARTPRQVNQFYLGIAESLWSLSR